MTIGRIVLAVLIWVLLIFVFGCVIADCAEDYPEIHR